jgi:hypothetical protein
MENLVSANHSTLKEWSNFMTMLNNKKRTDRPLLKKARVPQQMVSHLEKQFLSYN